MTFSLVVSSSLASLKTPRDTDPGKEVHFLNAIGGCRVFFHWLRFHSAWETVTSLISHGFPEKVAGGAATGRQATQAQVVKDGPGVRACGLPSLWPGSRQRAACHAVRGGANPAPCLEGSLWAVVPGQSLPGRSWQSRGHAVGLEESGGPASSTQWAHTCMHRAGSQVIPGKWFPCFCLYFLLSVWSSARKAVPLYSCFLWL